ncbi:hypothetical protein Y032_0010g1163 [Ancylostoma ceylanicum]|uniref:Glycoprotein n=1 Tax=Ancylostoma ceylanicum TaxID=53326 RepID=A0A016VHG4_9BILA|nr:hypothetical protein Y032_0010g1163 [Ancylostoma ceylanicum]
MKQHHLCDYGTLHGTGAVFKTSNELKFDWPSAPFGCCTTHRISVTNCFLLPTVIHSRHGSPTPESSVGDVHHCAYKDGQCVLNDGSVLLWTPNEQESCQFVSVSKMRGHQIGHVWISDSKEFALSWREDSPTVRDCGQDLTVTDQSYALITMRRTPRSASRVGIVTSNQLAAQLLAVEDSVQGAVTALFHHSLSSLCDRTNLLAFSLHSSFQTDPTYTIRKLLGRNDVAATYFGGDLVQLHRCIKVPSANYRLRAFNGTCFTKPRVEFRLPRGVYLSAFMDPQTNVITNEAFETPCHNVPFFLLNSANGTVKFDAVTGSSFLVPPQEVTNIGFPRDAEVIATPPSLTIFHNLVLTNLSELVSDHQLEEIWQARSYDRLLTSVGSQTYSQSSSLPGPSSQDLPFLEKFLFGWSPFYVWVTLCCVGFSFSFAKTVVKAYFTINFPSLLQALRAIRFAPTPPSHPNQSRQFLTPPPAEIRTRTPSPGRTPPRDHRLDLSCVEIDASGACLREHPLAQ